MSRWIARLLVTVALLTATAVSCSPGDETTASHLHPADDACENGRADELGAPFPADDIYLDAEVVNWPRAAPANVGFDPAVLASAVENVDLNGSVLSLLVAREGHLVVEEYFNGAEASHAHNIFSVTKLLTALALGSAVDDGIVSGLDTTLGEWVEEIAGSPAEGITLEQLLSMTSGLSPEATEPFSPDVVAATPLDAEPGATWTYSTDNSELLALGLDRRVPGGLCEYAHTQILRALGVSVDHWHQTPYGNVTGGSYAFLTPRELARLGQLVLDRGSWDGEQVVPGTWIEAITETRTDFGCKRGNAASSNRPVRSGAGMHVSTAEVAGYEIWAPQGFGGQAILVVPDLDIVVVVTQEVGPVFERRLSVLDLLEFGLLPAVIDAHSPTASSCPTDSLVLLDGQASTPLPLPAGGQSDWSPNGRRIAVSSNYDLNPELYLVAVDGTDVQRLSTDGAADVLPRWSPDGTLLAFSSDRGRPHQLPLPEFDLWLLDAATGETRPLTEGMGDVLGHSWSPDGTQIVFTRTRTDESPYGDLWLVDVGSGRARLLAEGNYGWPEWSPDGEAVAFVTERSLQPYVALFDLESGEQTDVAPGNVPRWSDDGGSLLVTRDDAVITIDLGDRSEEVLTVGCCASVAPDGFRFVVSRED